MAGQVAEKAKSLVIASPASPPARNNRGQFLQGSTGNPGGRPKGSRNRLGEAFVEALFQDFQEHGIEAIAEMRVTDPSGYIRAVASILPREARVEAKDDLDDLSDEELRALVIDALEDLAEDCSATDLE